MSPVFAPVRRALGEHLCVVFGQATVDGRLAVVVNSDPHEHPPGQQCASAMLVNDETAEILATGTDS